MNTYEDVIVPIFKIFAFFIIATVIYIPFYIGASYGFYLCFGYDDAAALAWIIVWPLLGASSYLLYKTKLGKYLSDL